MQLCEHYPPQAQGTGRPQPAARATPRVARGSPPLTRPPRLTPASPSLPRPCPPGTHAQSYKSLADALNQSQFSRLKGIVDTLGLTKTFSNPDLKLTVFVPTDAVSCQYRCTAYIALGYSLQHCGIAWIMPQPPSLCRPAAHTACTAPTRAPRRQSARPPTPSRRRPLTPPASLPPPPPTPQAFNSAIARYANNPLVSLDSLLQQRSLVQQVVYYHIAKEVVRAPLPKKTFNTMVTGRTLEGDGMTVKGVGSSAKITKANVAAGQSLAHEIDNVLLFVNVAGLLG